MRAKDLSIPPSLAMNAMLGGLDATTLQTEVSGAIDEIGWRGFHPAAAAAAAITTEYKRVKAAGLQPWVMRNAVMMLQDAAQLAGACLDPAIDEFVPVVDASGEPTLDGRLLMRKDDLANIRERMTRKRRNAEAAMRKAKINLIEK